MSDTPCPKQKVVPVAYDEAVAAEHAVRWADAAVASPAAPLTLGMLRAGLLPTTIVYADSVFGGPGADLFVPRAYEHAIGPLHDAHFLGNLCSLGDDDDSPVYHMLLSGFDTRGNRVYLRRRAWCVSLAAELDNLFFMELPDILPWHAMRGVVTCDVYYDGSPGAFRRDCDCAANSFLQRTYVLCARVDPYLLK